MSDTIYAITNPRTNLAYVGRTHRALVDRWTEHLNDAADQLSHKRLAEALRHDPDGFTIEELDSKETASEREWYDAFALDGWQMLNDAPPNQRTPKRRDTGSEHAWRAMNDEAMYRLNLLEARDPTDPLFQRIASGAVQTAKVVSYRPKKNPPPQERPELSGDPWAAFTKQSNK